MGSTNRIAFLLLIACLQRSISVYCQTQEPKVTLSEKNAPLEKILHAITSQTGITFFGDASWPQLAHKVTIFVKNMPYTQALAICFKGQPLTYGIVGESISIHVVKAKDFVLKGTIVNERQEGVPGANIVSKGLGKVSNAVTDEQGGFSIFLGKEDTSVVITSIGYETREIEYHGQEEIKVQVSTKIIELEGASVTAPAHTGYNVIPKETATGSYSQVSGVVLERKVSTGILDRLDGVTSALIFNKNTVPSQNPSAITIRGRSTILGNPDPLIVVDNFPYSGNINNINPEDIESVTVLKDAAAASIWGAFSGNGVIVMTTKKGKYGQKKKWSFTTGLTVGEKPDLYYQPILSSRDYIQVERTLYDSGFYSANINDPNFALSPALEVLRTNNNVGYKLDSLGNLDTRRDLNKYYYQPSVSQLYALNFSGGGKRDHYFISAGYNKDVSNLVRNQYNRITIRGSNTWSVIPKKLEISTDVTYTHSGMWNNNSGYFNANYPYARAVDNNGKPLAVAADFQLSFVDTVGHGNLQDWYYRPLDDLNNANNKTNINDVRLNTGIRYNIWDGLSVNLYYQYQHGLSDQKNSQSLQTFFTRDLINSYAQPDNNNGGYTFPIPVGGIMNETVNRYDANNLRAQLNFDDVFSPDHKLDFLAGWELRDVEGHVNNTLTYGITTDAPDGQTVDYNTLFYQPYSGSAAKIPNPEPSYGTSDRFLSYYANAAYTFRQRYTFSASVRRDESNLFGVKANQKGVPLWSTGVAWELSKEGFYRVDWLPFLKLRATYGYNGNVDRSVSAYTTAQMSGLLNDYNELFSSIVNPPNPSLRWEKIGMFNIGLDFAGKDSRLEGTLEYYMKNSKDLIGQTVKDPTTGVVTFTGNTANMMVHGIDLTLHTRNLAGRVKWNSDWLVSYALDKVTRYDLTQPSVSAYFQISSLNPLVGHPLYSIYALKWRGLDPVTGDPRGELNGQPNTDYSVLLNAPASSLIYKGAANPPVFGSWRNTFAWKQFEFSFNILFKLGYYFHRNSIQYYVLYNGVSKGNSDYALRWKHKGDESITNVPSAPLLSKLTSNRDEFYKVSDVLIEKGDHVRLQDIRLSYDLPKKVYPGLPVQAVRFYFYANNIGILWSANHRNIDPDYINSIPNPRTLALGCKLEF